jgi:hypothetical protein
MKMPHRWLILAGIVALLLITGAYYFQDKSMERTKAPSLPTPPVTKVPTPATPTALPRVSNQEQQLIESWIKENNLNFYGDPKDALYGGGTPLFDEMTGKSKDRFEYIITNHPERPWNK